MSPAYREICIIFQASRRICNPALKNVLTYLCSADLQSAAKEYAFPLIGTTYNSPIPCKNNSIF